MPALATCLLSMLAGRALALDPELAITQYVRDSWTARDGAPSGTITAIIQTPAGYLWLGTEAEGLVRFDGVRFDRVTELDTAFSRPVLRITSLLHARDGTIWVGTGFGLGRYRAGRWTVLDGGESKDVVGLHEADDGTIWYARHWEGLYRVAGDRVELLSLPEMPRVIASDAHGVLWVGGYRGFLRIAGAERRNYAGREGIAAQVAVAALFRDRDGAIWVGTHDGLVLLRKDAVVGRYTVADGLSHNDVTRVFQDRAGNVWAGTTGGGLNRLRGRRFESLTKVQGLTNNHVTTIFEDREGSLWLGTKGGLNRLRTGSFRPLGEAEGLSLNNTRSIAETAGGSVWIMTDGGGLNRIQNGRIRTYRMRDGLSSDYGGPLFVGGDGSLWIGQNGPTRFKDGLFTNNPLSDYVSAITEDARGLIIASYGKVLRFANGVATPYRLKNGAALGPESSGFDYVWHMHTAADGTLWLATTRGAFAVRDGVATRVWASGTLSARAVSEQRDGTIWLATMAGAIRVADGRTTSFGLAQGLPHDDIFHVLQARDGDLWMSCSRGIFRVGRQDVENLAAGKTTRVEPQVFGIGEGMRTSEATNQSQPAGCAMRDGTLWFTTTEGVAVVAPDRIGKNTLEPPVVIESVLADGEEIDLSRARVSAGRERIEIRYDGLSLLQPEKVRFEYQLEGYDRGFVAAGGQRVAHYMNLPPGSYTFHVRAANNDGVWNRTGRMLELTLEPRLYQRTSVRVLLLLLSAVGLVFVFRWRERATAARRRELEALVARRTADLELVIGEQARTAASLQQENEQRRRAEEEAEQAARRLTQSNAELVAGQQALERENSERQRAEEAAGRERDLLHALMDNIPDLIYFKDARSRFVRVNAAQAAALGAVNAAAALGKTDADYFPRELAQATLAEEQELLRSSRPLVGKLQHDARGGRWHLVTKVPLRDKGGALAGLVGVSKDITERKLAEERLEEELRRFLDVVSVMARGDLTACGQEGDETLGRIARSVNGMLASFSSILSEVRDTALSVSSASSEILAATTQIAKGAQYGNDQVHTTSAAVEQMAASMDQVSRNAEASSEKARLVLEHVQQGHEATDVVHRSMARIDAAATETAEKMRLLEKRSAEIFEIIELIDDLAAQSELLSLNAAIEAAHAGDYGRGFAVVAEEVRRLADRSKKATDRVSSIVDAMVEEVKTALQAMQHAVREVQEGRTLSARAIESLGEIRALVRESADLSAQISLASREQSVATGSVADSMQAIANMTHESAAAANSSSGAVQGLVALSEQLTAAIARFKLAGDHAGSGSAPRGRS
jgi:PAS domain S-box-containing protein